MLENALKQIVAEKKKDGASQHIILNYLREYIQYAILHSLYTHKEYKSLIFKGGSCLRVCYGLPRLSEDLDFDIDVRKIKNFSINKLKVFLEKQVKKKYVFSLETKLQGTKRIYLKFPILHRLGVSGQGESDRLYVKIETDEDILPFAHTELTPISHSGFNFIVRNYDLPTLMVGKIHAFLFRLWFKGKKNEIDIKGRDFYDLFWFLQKKVVPNWKCLRKITGIKNDRELKNKLLAQIKKTATAQKLRYDLQNFLPDSQFVDDFCLNYMEIMSRYLNERKSLLRY